MTKFKKATFDETKYRNKKEELTKWAAKIDELRDKLAQEGLPATKEFIEKITADEMAFDRWIKEEYQGYLDRLGFVPATEKKRILENFNNLYFGINPLVQSAMAAINSGVVLNPDGTVNDKKIEELAREEGTTTYDAKAMEAYYAEVTKARGALNTLKKYEEAHNIKPGFTETILTNGQLLPPRITTFKGDEEEFQRNYGVYFTVKEK